MTTIVSEAPNYDTDGSKELLQRLEEYNGNIVQEARVGSLLIFINKNVNSNK